jgi:hypothetical protein
MALGIASLAPISNGDRSSVQLPRVVDFSGGDQAEMQRLRSQRGEAIAVANAVRNRPARHIGNQPA